MDKLKAIIRREYLEHPGAVAMIVLGWFLLLSKSHEELDAERANVERARYTAGTGSTRS